MVEEEEALVARILAGESRAEDEFYKMYRTRLLRAALYFLGGQDAEAEDIVQETFVIAFPKLKDYVFRAPIYAWLKQICLRLCYARLRKRKRTLVSLEEDLELYMQRLAVERLQKEALDVKRDEKLLLLSELKKQLNHDSAEIIQLRNVEGLSYVLISQALGIPIGTVMSRLSRARDQMRKLVEGRAADDAAKEGSC